MQFRCIIWRISIYFISVHLLHKIAQKRQLTRIYVDRLPRNNTSNYTDRSIFTCTNSKNVYRCKVETWTLDNGCLVKNQKYLKSSIRYISYLLRSVFCKSHRSNKNKIIKCMKKYFLNDTHNLNFQQIFNLDY